MQVFVRTQVLLGVRMAEDRKVIWLICQYASPIKYGFGSRHFYLSEEFVKQGYQVYIFTSTFNHLIHTPIPDGSAFNFETENGVNVCYIRTNHYTNPAGVQRIFSWLLFCLRLLFIPKHIPRPTTVIVSSPSLFPILNGIWFRWRHSARLLFEIRDIWPLTLRQLGNASAYNPLIVLMSWAERLGYKYSDVIVSTLPRLDLHVKQVHKGEFTFKCIPQGLDPNVLDKPEPVDQQFIEQYIPPNKFVIGYAGALGLSNALECFVDAAKHMESKRPELHFVLLGDGPHKKELEKRMGGATNIVFIPKVKKTQVGSILAKCDLLYDSVKSVELYNYGLSRNKWMDYMLSGKPLLVSYSGYLSLINEADCGKAVPGEDAIALEAALEKFADLPSAELTAMGQRGRDYVLKNRTFNTLAGSYVSLF